MRNLRKLPRSMYQGWIFNNKNTNKKPMLFPFPIKQKKNKINIINKTYKKFMLNKKWDKF